MKILLLKPSSLGDVVQALPVLRLLKQHLPESRIYWWVESSLAPLLEGDPDLAGVVHFERRRWAAPGNWLRLWQTIRWMREQKFDWVIDLQCLARSGLFAWLANGDLTIGLDEPREGARGFYDLVVRRPSFYTHAVNWYLGVLPVLGVPVHWRFEWLPPRPDVAAAVRRKWPVAGSRWIVLQPGARWPNKRWPIDYFANVVQLGSGLPAEFRFAILGGPEDRPLGEQIARVASQRCLDLTGHLSLPEMIEWVRLSEAMITNDTGPMHVGAALRRPLVALFGPTEPRRTGPFGQLENVLNMPLPCAPCMRPRCTWVRSLECLCTLKPETVFAALRNRLFHA